MLLVAISELLLPISAATAQKPLTLSYAQMDRVVAGAVASAIGLADGLGSPAPCRYHRLIDGFGSVDAGIGGSNLLILCGRASPAVFRQRRHAKIPQLAHIGT